MDGIMACWKFDFVYLFICILIPATKLPDTDKPIWKKIMLIDKFFY
jgi:hypothetical protein